MHRPEEHFCTPHLQQPTVFLTPSLHQLQAFCTPSAHGPWSFPHALHASPWGLLRTRQGQALSHRPLRIPTLPASVASQPPPPNPPDAFRPAHSAHPWCICLKPATPQRASYHKKNFWTPCIPHQTAHPQSSQPQSFYGHPLRHQPHHSNRLLPIRARQPTQSHTSGVRRVRRCVRATSALPSRRLRFGCPFRHAVPFRPCGGMKPSGPLGCNPLRGIVQTLRVSHRSILHTHALLCLESGCHPKHSPSLKSC